MPKLHFLLLEDDPADVELISTTLMHSDLDCDFSVVETQADFQASIATQSFDLVLADYSLPSFTGLTAIEMAQTHCPEVPCILVSGVLGEERAISALKSGAADYVLKQRLERLLPAVKRALREKEERAALAAATAALRESEERFRTSVETMVDSFAILAAVYDEAGYIQTFTVSYLNAAACTYLSVSREQQIGQPLLSVIPGLRHAANVDVLEAYRYVLETGHPFQEEIFLQSADPDLSRADHFVALDMRAAKLGDGLVVTWRDTTERRQAEDQRSQLLKDAQAARRQAEEASRFRDDFLASVSHELRSPLSAIDGWIQLFLAQRLTPDMQRKALQSIQRNTSLLERLISDILDVSRIVQGKLKLQVQPLTLTELSTLVAVVIDIVTPAAQAKNIEIDFVASNLSAQLLGDTDRLQQAVWNLLSNAVKFTPAKGQVTVKVQQRDQVAVLTVQDTGTGILGEQLTEIFNPFGQAQTSLTSVQKGLGLGLAITQHIVEAHGGQLEAYSAGHNQGSTFQIELPLSAPDEDSTNGAAYNFVSGTDMKIASETEAERILASSNLSLAGVHVLVVEDAPDAREVYQLMLQEHGADVKVAATVAEAFETFQTFRPHVLVSDLTMPEEDGYALIRKIRGLSPQAGGKTPAVALTAYVQRQYRTRALLAGFQIYIPKPVFLDELVTVVSMLAQSTPD